MSELSDQLKVVTTQASNYPSPQPIDPNVEAMLQSLLIEDPSLMRILKGEIQEVLNKVEESRLRFVQQSSVLFDHYKLLSPDQGLNQLMRLICGLKDLSNDLEGVKKEAKRYRRYVPYLLLFTSSSVLSNVSEKQAIALWRKIDIMITRDRLDCMDDENALEDLNFFDSIGIKAYLHILRNVGGHTFKGLIEEKRTVTNVITDQTQKQKGRGRGWLHF